MKRILSIFITAIAVNFSFGQTWTTITSDVSGDGNSASLLDGTLLEYSYDQVNDSVWFRITNSQISVPQSTNLGFNVMINYTGGGSTFNFWGSDNSNPYHKLVTGWVTGTSPSNYSGTIGIADAAGVNSSSFTNLSSNNLDIIVSTANSTITIGMKRSDLVPSSALNLPILTAAAVGASTAWNDDLYSGTGTMTLNSNVGIDEISTKKDISIYPNPVDDVLTINLTNSDVEEILIVDLAGNVLSRGTSTVINVNALETGIYLLNILDIDQKQISTYKFFKK